jgi:hypothetical protein
MTIDLNGILVMMFQSYVGGMVLMAAFIVAAAYMHYDASSKRIR